MTRYGWNKKATMKRKSVRLVLIGGFDSLGQSELVITWYE